MVVAWQRRQWCHSCGGGDGAAAMWVLLQSWWQRQCCCGPVVLRSWRRWLLRLFLPFCPYPVTKPHPKPPLSILDNSLTIILSTPCLFTTSPSIPLPRFFIPICWCGFPHLYLRPLTHLCLLTDLRYLVLYLDPCSLWQPLPRPLLYLIIASTMTKP